MNFNEAVQKYIFESIDTSKLKKILSDIFYDDGKMEKMWEDFADDVDWGYDLEDLIDLIEFAEDSQNVPKHDESSTKTSIDFHMGKDYWSWIEDSNLFDIEHIEDKKGREDEVIELYIDDKGEKLLKEFKKLLDIAAQSNKDIKQSDFYKDLIKFMKENYINER